MNIFSLFKSKKQQCNHRWELLHTETETVEESNGIDIDIYKIKVVYCYCHKCKNREKITPLEWELRMKQQEMDDKYDEEIRSWFK